MNAELHLPDLPEVPVSLGVEPGPPRHVRIAWSDRLRGAFGTYLPLLVLGLLAVGTWWLVKNSPPPLEAGAARAVVHVPDYTLQRFTLQRFDAQGSLVAQIEGEQLRHFPDTDEIEIDTVRLITTTPDGRVSRATARHAVATGDHDVVRLEGGARVVSTDLQGRPTEIEGDRLTAYVQRREVRATEPVRVRQQGSEFTADSMEFQQATQMLTLHGKVRATLLPQSARR